MLRDLLVGVSVFGGLAIVFLVFAMRASFHRRRGPNGEVAPVEKETDKERRDGTDESA
jgi:hypothetical protein